MGQAPSQEKLVLQNRTPTPEPSDPEEAARLKRERERKQAEVWISSSSHTKILVSPLSVAFQCSHVTNGSTSPLSSSNQKIFLPTAKTDNQKERARRAAAAEQRVAALQRRKMGVGNGAGGSGAGKAAPKKRETPLEQMSRENRGWRDADVQADVRAWN
jgi:hypothetical protein